MKENENVILLKLTLFWLKISESSPSYVQQTAGLFKSFKILNKNSIHFCCILYGSVRCLVFLIKICKESEQIKISWGMKVINRASSSQAANFLFCV